MAATITKLATRSDRLRQDQADRLRDALHEIEGQLELPIGAMRTLYAQVVKNTASRNRWTFVMLSPEQNDVVVNYLTTHSKRPLVAVRLWSLCFRHLRTDTGEIMLSRDELAERTGQQSRTISETMGELEACGAIIRQRDRVAGMKGRGLVRYFMNPRVATHLAGSERDTAQDAAPPLLTLMQGGKNR